MSKPYGKFEAIDRMNRLGATAQPFIFIIDYEMNKIRLYPTTEKLPASLMISFPTFEVSNNSSVNWNDFQFHSVPVSFAQYKKSFKYVKDNIQEGNSFLANLTFPSRIETDLPFTDIYHRAIAKYKLCLEKEFVCFSPETFVTINQGQISTFPMKGTIDASKPNALEKLLGSEKEIAEHNTTVDLLRNDLSIVASDVEVKRFRYVDRLKTNFGDIYQISSEITGRLASDYASHIGTIIFSMLPAGSVTGAPKTKTLEIIKAAEGHDRGYYCGVFGYFDGQNLDSAVAIRFIEKRAGRLYYRSGGGITSQSMLTDEYNELIQKIYVPIPRKY